MADIEPPTRRHAPALPLPDEVALVLQGGGALGSYQAGVIEHNLGDDTEVLRATEVLENPTEYQEITTMQTSEKK